MAFRTGLETDILFHLLRGAYNPYMVWDPSDIFLGLWIGDPGDGEGGFDPGDSGNHEVSGAGYARVEVSTQSEWKTIGGSTPAGETFVNLAAITFGQAEEDWGDVTHFVLCSSLTGLGIQILLRGGLAGAPITIESGSIPRFAAEALAVSLD